MTKPLDFNKARGRLLAAARMMADLHQKELADKAGLTQSAISNAENGINISSETYRSIRKSLRQSGIVLHMDRSNCLALVGFHFERPTDDDED